MNMNNKKSNAKENKKYVLLSYLKDSAKLWKCLYRYVCDENQTKYRYWTDTYFSGGFPIHYWFYFRVYNVIYME